MCLLHPPLLPSQMLGSMWCHLLTLICKLVYVLNPAISKIKTEDNTGIHFSDKKVELACDRPWLPALEPEEDSRAPAYTVHVSQGLTKMNHMRSMADSGLIFQFHSLRMKKTQLTLISCVMLLAKSSGYHSRPNHRVGLVLATKAQSLGSEGSSC